MDIITDDKPIIETNEFQTPITESLFSNYPKEIKDLFMDYVTRVPFIHHLISKDRPRARDLERDEQGRIIVDLAHPHILENMDYFRPAARHFEHYGCYTLLRPDNNPNSPYGRWAREEIRRCWEGMVRPEDGEWVTGYLYFYLNYTPMMLTKIDERSNNIRRASRVIGFPEVWESAYWRFHYIDQARNGGKYNNFRGGNHAVELSKRGSGKSFSLAAIMAHNLILGENKLSQKRTTTILTAYTSEYLSAKDGTVSKFLPIKAFLAANTQFPRRMLIDSKAEMLWTAGYKDKNTGAERGTLNTVLALSSKDNVSKIRGKRGTILFEEFGTFPHLLEIYCNIKDGMQEGDYVYGLAYLVGTAGDRDSDFHGAQELVYNSEGYNIYSLPNMWDKEQQGKTSFAFFTPAYINIKGLYNKDGVSDITASLLYLLKRRYETKYLTQDPKAIVKEISNMPITPSEAIIKGAQNIFPVPDIEERLLKINSDPHFYDNTYVGTLTISSRGDVLWRPTNDMPIRSFPHKNNKGMIGALEIYEMPKRDSAGNVPYDRYIAGADPYDNDESGTTSLGSILVLDLITDRIVAEYTGRPVFADEYFEICRRLCIFYNCRLNYENNKKGLFAYFAKTHSIYLLTDVLDILIDKDMTKPGGIGNTQKGTNASQAINGWCRQLIARWLISENVVASTQEDQILYNERQREKNEKKNNNKKEDIYTKDDALLTHKVITNVQLVKGKALLQELASWNAAGNFDRVSALGMLMLLREDRLRLFSSGHIGEDNYDDLAQDEYFVKNYGAYSKEDTWASGAWMGN